MKSAWVSLLAAVACLAFAPAANAQNLQRWEHTGSGFSFTYDAALWTPADRALYSSEPDILVMLIPTTADSGFRGCAVRFVPAPPTLATADQALLNAMTRQVWHPNNMARDFPVPVVEQTTFDVVDGVVVARFVGESDSQRHFYRTFVVARGSRSLVLFYCDVDWPAREADLAASMAILNSLSLSELPQ